MSERRAIRARRWKLAQPIRGSAGRPRLVVSRGLRSIQGHFVNDDAGMVLCGASSSAKRLGTKGYGCEAARALGKELARIAKERGIEKAVFDRNGYVYHGRIKALAEGARQGGLVL